jgi:hypothetical protein
MQDNIAELQEVSLTAMRLAACTLVPSRIKSTTNTAGDTDTVITGSTTTADTSGSTTADGAIASSTTAVAAVDSDVKLAACSNNNDDSSGNTNDTISNSISALDSVVLRGMHAAQLTMSETAALQQQGVAMVASHELLEGQVIAKVLSALSASLGSASRYASLNFLITFF